jgi:hypothetical protein
MLSSIMTDNDRILRELQPGDFRLTLHAQERMAERQVTTRDIRECARTSKEVTEQDDSKFKVSGFDLDGEALNIICVWDGETLVITVF